MILFTLLMDFLIDVHVLMYLLLHFENIFTQLIKTKGLSSDDGVVVVHSI